MRSFLSYIGGKSRLAAEIAARLPASRCYVEVFGGAAWVLFARAPAPVEILNDLDGRLINLYRVVRDRPAALARELTLIPRSRALFKEFEKRIAPTNNIRAAAIQYYLLKNAFAAHRGAGFSTSPLHPGRYRMLHDFGLWAERLNNVTIEQLDFADCLGKYDNAHTVFYLDPPYLGKEFYYLGFTRDDHERLRLALNRIKGRWLMSYNDCPAVRRLYRDFKRTRIGTAYCAARSKHHIPKTELLISNY